MKLLKAQEIKKIILGVTISDGYIDMKGYRFELYSKHEGYAKYVHSVISQITGMSVKMSVKHDKRGYAGYRVTTRKHAYWKNIGEKIYNGRKELNSYVVDRIDELTLANMWMCDGYLEHSKNRRANKVQNVGWFCLEAFPKEELELLQAHLLRKWGISSSLIKKPWGFGWRIRVGGENLQKLISIIYPHIIECFKYKTSLYYKQEKSADMELPSAKQYIHIYESVEDIVRDSQ